MKYILFLNRLLENLPPLLNGINVLASLGEECVVITETCRDSTAAELTKKNVTVYRQYSQDEYENRSVAHRKSGKFRRILRRVKKCFFEERFRSYAWKTFKKISDKEDILWVGSSETALELGTALLSHNYILHVHELCEYPPNWYKNHFAHQSYPVYYPCMTKYANRAKAIIVPDESRAAIARYYWGLSRTPFVIPNKYFGVKYSRNAPLTNAEYQKIIEAVDRPIIISQGILGKLRNIENVARAIRDYLLPVQLLILGRDRQNSLARLREICPDLIHFDFIVPPHHLEITGHATIGILQYNFTSLNQVFCAPNKIWEYTGMGVIPLSAELPPMRYLIGKYNAGRCCDFDSVADIAEAIRDILVRQEEYRRGAKALFDSCDMRGEYEKVLNFVQR